MPIYLGQGGGWRPCCCPFGLLTAQLVWRENPVFLIRSHLKNGFLHVAWKPIQLLYEVKYKVENNLYNNKLIFTLYTCPIGLVMRFGFATLNFCEVCLKFASISNRSRKWTGGIVQRQKRKEKELLKSIGHVLCEKS